MNTSCYVIQRIFNPRFLSYMTFYAVASNIGQALASSSTCETLDYAVEWHSMMWQAVSARPYRSLDSRAERAPRTCANFRPAASVSARDVSAALRICASS